jgi:N6-L-threonylcarbamoyladenine synthase
MASRAHQVNIVPVVDQALRKANVSKKELSAIAFTRGPGLIGSLIVGVTFAKTLALSLDIPIIEVNHMQAHVLAHFAEAPKPNFPFLCLTVSGGHTQIVLVRAALDMQVLGTTIDDAAGEAFDKTGKVIGLTYPAGPIMDKLAQQGTARFEFAEPNVDGLDFSFSGVKTSILYFLKKEVGANPDFIKNNMADICASVQHRIVSILMNKLQKAVKQTDIKEVAIAGGVSANSALRKAIQLKGETQGWNTYIPHIQYCTDNAGMIAVTAYFKYLAGDFASQDTTPMARMDF